MTDTKIIRQKLHLTQVEVAKLFGVHWSTVSRWDRKLVQPNLHQLSFWTVLVNLSEKKDKKVVSSIKSMMLTTGINETLAYCYRAGLL